MLVNTKMVDVVCFVRFVLSVCFVLFWCVLFGLVWFGLAWLGLAWLVCLFVCFVKLKKCEMWILSIRFSGIVGLSL